MGSPFKMSPKTPFMQALVGKQKTNLPEHLQQAILDAPAKYEPAKKYTQEDTTEGEAKTTTAKIKGGAAKGQTVKTTKQTVRKGGTYQSGGTASERQEQSTKSDRRGAGRLGERTTTEAGSQKRTKTAISGTKLDKQGRTKYRTLADGTKVVVEGSVSKIKKKGYALQSKGGSGKKETAGQKKYREAMERVAAQKAASAKRKKEGPKGGIRIKKGMGTSLSTYRIGGKK